MIHFKISKSTVRLALLFVFALGIELGFLLDFQAAEHRFQLNRQSLDDTASCLVLYADCEEMGQWKP